MRSSSTLLLLLTFVILFAFMLISCNEVNNPTSLGGFNALDSSKYGEEKEFPLSDDVNIIMIWIPSGTYDMGSPVNELDRRSNEEPVHTVTIENGFWMGKYEVTQVQWLSVTNSNPSNNNGKDHPVEFITWIRIHDQFLSQINDKYRLPSEAEWEYACRAGTHFSYFWSNDDTGLNSGDFVWNSLNSKHRSQDVGGKYPNAWGLHDMIGNVWEWCEDLAHDTYHGAPLDGSAWDTGESSARIYRGGSYFSNLSSCRSAYRVSSMPDGKSSNLGFRLVRDAD